MVSASGIERGLFAIFSEMTIPLWDTTPSQNKSFLRLIKCPKNIDILAKLIVLLAIIVSPFIKNMLSRNRFIYR